MRHKTSFDEVPQREPTCAPLYLKHRTFGPNGIPVAQLDPAPQGRADEALPGLLQPGRRQVQNKNRADILLQAGRHKYLIDTTITTPQHIPANLNTAGAAALQGEREKTQFYSARYEIPTTASVVPLSFDTFGCSTEAGLRFLQQVAKVITNGTDKTNAYSLTVKSMYETVSLAIQRSNARMLEEYRELHRIPRL